MRLPWTTPCNLNSRYNRPGDLPPEFIQLLEPIIATAKAGQNVEPLLAELREQFVQAGITEEDADELLEPIRKGLV